tara:strand:- start:40481 stop:40768 length:288 start_codon:yes stop_codon:yes gene_type:complete
MRLTKSFFGDPLTSGLIRRYILSKLTGEKIDEDNRKDYPLLESWVSVPLSSQLKDHVLRYNGCDFYCVGNVNQINSQLTTYFQLHRDDTIDKILK